MMNRSSLIKRMPMTTHDGNACIIGNSANANVLMTSSTKEKRVHGLD